MHLSLLLLLLTALAVCEASIYCGEDNCYTLLEVTKDASEQDIRKAYKTLAIKWHPDKNREADATARFQRISQAYEVLSNPPLREAYDDYLANPQNHFRAQYYYYRHRYIPQSDLRVVLLVFLSAISIFHFVVKLQTYRSDIEYSLNAPKNLEKIKARAEEIMTRRGINKKKASQREKDAAMFQAKEEAHEQLVGKGGKPSWRDIVIVKLVILPYRILQFVQATMIRNRVLKNFGDKEVEFVFALIPIPDSQRPKFLLSHRRHVVRRVLESLPLAGIKNVERMIQEWKNGQVVPQRMSAKEYRSFFGGEFADAEENDE